MSRGEYHGLSDYTQAFHVCKCSLCNGKLGRVEAPSTGADEWTSSGEMVLHTMLHGRRRESGLSEGWETGKQAVEII